MSLSIANRDALELAAELFDKQGISHGEIIDLGEALKLYVMAFCEPDNIQLELTAPFSS